MGAQNSVVRSIESLSCSLNDLEKRLYEIESIELHHEAGYISSSALHISGKMIPCNSNVRLLVGPILGFIGTEVCRILVEVDHETTLSLNVFRKNYSALHFNRFVRTFHLKVPNCCPVAFTITDLDPESEYEVYIGGVCFEDAVKSLVSFTTLSPNLSNLRSYIVHSNCVNKPLSHVDAFDEIWKRVAEGQSVTSILIHSGGLVAIEDHVRAIALELINEISTSYSVLCPWRDYLDRFEAAVKVLYKNALTNPSLKELAKHCGCFFLAGEQETIYSWLMSLINLYIYQKDENEMNAKIEQGEKTDGSLLGKVAEDSSNFNAQARTEESTTRHKLLEYVISAMARAARRMQWIYCRQLWDESILDFIEADLKREELLREKTKALLEQGSSQTSHLDQINAELKTMFGRLYKLAELCGEMNMVIQKPEIIRPVYCGSLQVVVVDALWNHIASDGMGWQPAKDVFLTIVLSALPLVDSTNYTRKLQGNFVLELDNKLIGKQRGSNSVFLEAEAVDLVRSLLLWQQEDERRKTLFLASSMDLLTIRSSLQPILRREDIEDDIWKEGLYTAEELLIGPFRASQKLIPPQAVMHLSASPELPDSSSSASFVRFTEDVARADNIWRILYRESSSPLSISTSAGAANENMLKVLPASLTFDKLIADRGTSSSIIYGPIIGQVTSFSAEILLEVACPSNDTVFFSLACVDALSGVEVLASRRICSGSPFVFHFEDLSPNHYYEIFGGIDESHSKSRRRYGGFTTLPQSQLEHYFDIHSMLRRRLLSSNEEPETRGLSLTSREQLRILFLGDFSLRRLSLDDVAFRSNPGVIYDLTDLAGQPWSGIDLIAHAGTNILDWKAALDQALAYLSQAEVLKHANYDSRYQNLVKNADLCIKDLMRFGLGGSSAYGRLLSRGSHILLSDPLSTLLRSYNTTSFSMLCHEFSSFSVHSLLRLLTKAFEEYRQSIWPSSFVDPNGMTVVAVEEGISFVSLSPVYFLKDHSRLSTSAILTIFYRYIQTCSATIHTLVIISPSPITPAYHDPSIILPEEENDLQFSVADIVAILDTCWGWRKEDFSNRQVLFVSTGTLHSLSTQITVRSDSEDLVFAYQISFGTSVESCNLADARTQTTGQLPSSWPSTSYLFSHMFPNEHLNGSPFANIVELSRKSPHIISFAWYDEVALRELMELGSSENIMDRKRVAVDESLLNFMENALSSRTKISDDDEISKTVGIIERTVEELLESDKGIVRTVFEAHYTTFLPSNSVSIASWTERFFPEVFEELTDNLSSRSKGLLKIPSVPITLYAWQLFCKSKDDDHSEGLKAALLTQLMTDFVQFMDFAKTTYALQLRCEAVAFHLGLQD
eukprot:scaffold4845_cov159-Ochromonas_danica.AAC.12